MPVEATHPLYILYTSGTTGQPKGVVHDTGGYCVALYWSMKNLYGIEPGECGGPPRTSAGWSATATWSTARCSTARHSILYEGKPVGTPDAGAFWRVISEYKAVALFTAPTAFRAIKKEDPDGKLLKSYDLSSFRTLFLAGERGDPPTIQWAQTMLGVPIVDHWWQTETGWSICGNFQGLEPMPIKPGSCSVPAPGWDLHVLDDSGKPMKRGEVGALVAKLPMPPGTFPTLWKADERFKEAYLAEYPGYYKTGDAGYIDEDGYVSVMTRVDDVINVAGHRLSTGQIEEVLASHDDVAECAVLGIADELKGQVPLGFLVLKAGVDRPDGEIISEVVQMVRDRIGPVAFFKQALVVPRLPKTRSGKILRGTMQKIADGQPWKMPATIDDPAALEEVTGSLKIGRLREQAGVRAGDRHDSRHQPPRSHGGRGRHRRHGPRHRAGDGAGWHQGDHVRRRAGGAAKAKAGILETLKGLVAKGRLTDADSPRPRPTSRSPTSSRTSRPATSWSRRCSRTSRSSRSCSASSRPSWRPTASSPPTPRRSASPRSRAR